MPQLVRQEQLRKPDDPDDQLDASAVSDIEAVAEDQEQFWNGVLSQLKRIIHGDDAGKWYDDLTTIFGADASLKALLAGGGGTGALPTVKSGVLIPGAFTGSPRRASVSFIDPYIDTGYAITFDPITINNMGYDIRAEDKTVNGFNVNLGTSQIGSLVEVGWHAIGGSTVNVKSGLILPAAFTGSPRRATVVFDVPYPNDEYAVVFDSVTVGNAGYDLRAESKTPFGFTMNLGANNMAQLVEVGWHAISVGE